MSLTYDTYVAQVSNMMVIPSTDSNFQTMLPGMIDYAEQRIYREINLLVTQVRDSAGNFLPNSRSFTLPTSFGSFVEVQGVNVVTPSSLALTTGGIRTPLSPVSLSMLDFLFPAEQATSSAAVPNYYAMLDQATIAVGPSPGSSYPVEVVGTIRPTPLSSSNTTTFLSQNLPDLLIAASMVFGFGFMRDFGGTTDNPQASESWEKQYKTLVTSAGMEEIRKKYNTTFAAQYAPQQASGGPV
jgi:hypothetical protein